MLDRFFALSAGLGLLHAAQAATLPGPPPKLDQSIIPAGATSTYARAYFYTTDSTVCAQYGTGTSIGYVLVNGAYPYDDGYNLVCGDASKFPQGSIACPDAVEPNTYADVTGILADMGIYGDPTEQVYRSVTCNIVDCQKVNCQAPGGLYLNYQTENNCDYGQVLAVVDYTTPAQEYSSCINLSSYDPSTDYIITDSDLSGHSVAAAIQGTYIGDGSSVYTTVSCDPGYKNVKDQCFLQTSTVPRRVRRRDGTFAIKRNARLPGFSH